MDKSNRKLKISYINALMLTLKVYTVSVNNNNNNNNTIYSALDPNTQNRFKARVEGGRGN